jgi:hypothetical protein
MTKPLTTRRGMIIASAVWTIYVWATRVRNIANNDTLGDGARTFAYRVCVVFIGAAIAMLVMLARRQLLRLRMFLPVFAVGTVCWWAGRSVLILVHHHSWAFRIVHIVLGIISSVLAVAAWRGARVRS